MSLKPPIPPTTGAPSLAAAWDFTSTPATNTRKRAWWSQTSGKLRFDAPPGVSNVMDPYYGSASRTTTSATATTAAIKNAIEDAGNFDAGTGSSDYGGEVWYPSGTYLVNDRLLGPSTPVEQIWRGTGRVSSIIKLDVSANLPNGDRPIVDLQSANPPNQTARFYCYDMMFQSSFRFPSTNPYGSEFPLVRVGGGDLSTFRSVVFWYAYGNGLHITATTLGGPPGQNIWTLDEIHAVSNLRNGILLDKGADSSVAIRRGSFQYNGECGVRLSNDTTVPRNYGTATIRDSHFEQNGMYSIMLDHQDAVLIEGNYLFKSPVYLDEQTNGCWVVHNMLLDSGPVASGTGVPNAYGGHIIDAGFNNVIAPNEGMSSQHPAMKLGATVQDLVPASQLPDGEMSRSNLVLGWTASGATVFKGMSPGVGERRLPQIGRGAPLRISQSVGGTPGGITATVPVTALDSYLFAVYWGSANNASACKLRVKVSNDADGVAFHNTGPITPPISISDSGVRPHKLQFACRVPAGVTTARVELLAESAATSAHYIFRADAIKLPVANAHMGGTYTAGIAEGWSAGTSGGTPTEETSAHDSSLGYVKAQKLAITAGAGSNESIEQTITPLDTTRFYVAYARVFVPVGQADPNVHQRVKLSLGRQDDSNYGWWLRPRRVGVWETLMRVFKPSGTIVSGTHRDKLSVGIDAHASFAGSVIVQEAYVVPLTENTDERTYVSPEMDLSGAAQSFVVGIPPQDSVLRSVTAIYTEATSVDAGIQIRVGDSVTATAYASATSGTSKAIDTTLDIVPTRTDLRGGVPVRVAHPGGKTGTGNVVVVLRYR